MDISIETISPRLRIHTLIDGTLISSRGYSIFKSKDSGKSWFLSGTLPVSGQKKILSKSRTISRALRIGIHQIKQIHNGKILIACDNGFFLSDPVLSQFKRINLNSHSFQLLDNNICVTPKCTYFSEYTYNFKKNEVNIFRTNDGKNWEIIYSFPKKSIKHIHLLQFDPFTQKIWFSTGDSDSECILGYANDDFSEVEVVGRNHQEWRCLELLFTAEKIYWGTDNPDGQNWLVSLDRNSHMIQKIARFNGPIYNLKHVSAGYVLVTATEGGIGEWDNRAHLWYTSDIEKLPWKEYISYQKDWMPLIFGFGRLLYGTDFNNSISLCGLALKNIDGISILISFNEVVELHE
jgi:hypothetical protein